MGEERETQLEQGMMPVEQALALVLGFARPLPAVQVALAQGLGRVLAEDVVAQEPLPPFPASVKDGYAVVAADGAGIYPLAGEVRAGQPADFRLEPGQVAYITTGAPLPPGADAVVMVEETSTRVENGSTLVRIGVDVAAGDDVRPVGVDVAPGQRVLARGDRLGPAELGILATVGVDRMAVYRRPRVAIMSTGDELVEPGAPLGPGQIRDSNRAVLAAAVAQLGGEPVDLGIVGDTPGALADALHRGLAEADILLSSGGVSMGDLDLMKPLLAQVGEVHFSKLLMKPGKPLTFATAAAPPGGEQAQADSEIGMAAPRLLFGLPGNPVSSMVTFLLMVAPALRRLAGLPDPHWPRVQVELGQELKLDAYRPEFHRATLRWDVGAGGGGGGFVAHSTGIQASSRLLSMRTANALLLLPRGQGSLPVGARVDALVIGDLI